MFTLAELESGIYSATIAGKPAVVVFKKRTRKSAADLAQSVTFNTEKIKQARKLANDTGAVPYVATEIWHKSEYVCGFAMPAELWSKYHTGAGEFPVGPKAIEAYKEFDQILKNFKAHIKKADKPKPATEPKPARNAARA
ncbi:MAG TPA: hypothetical protein VGT24_10010 [Candidatus Acidoferrales bacterium]|nr:hypothetical protein [Candidatus Acidoferrales bacterium]